MCVHSLEKLITWVNSWSFGKDDPKMILIFSWSSNSIPLMMGSDEYFSVIINKYLLSWQRLISGVREQHKQFFSKFFRIMSVVEMLNSTIPICCSLWLRKKVKVKKIFGCQNCCLLMKTCLTRAEIWKGRRRVKTKKLTEIHTWRFKIRLQEHQEHNSIILKLL